MDEKRRCDYLYVRHTKVSASSPDVPSKLYKVGVPAGGCSCIRHVVVSQARLSHWEERPCDTSSVATKRRRLVQS